MRRNGYLRTSDQKSDSRHSLRRHRFLIRREYLTLWPWPSTFWPWRCLMNKELDTSNVLTNSYRPTIICSWVMCDSIWSHYHYLEWSLRMRRVSRDLSPGGAFLKSLTLIHFPIHFVTYRELRRRLSHVIGCSLIEKPPKNEEKTSHPKARQNHVFWEQKPLKRSLQNFACPVLSTTKSSMPILVKIG